MSAGDPVDFASAVDALADVAHEPGAPKPDPIVTVDDTRRSFGGVHAVDIDHLEIQNGVITSIIGPNGAGKSTLYNVISGFDRGATGRIDFAGRRIDGLFAYRIARSGLVRTFQLTRSLARLTVLENMLIGARNQRGERLWAALVPPVWHAQEAANRERADELLERFDLAEMRDEFASTLSGGQRKLLEMARALMVEPDLLLLDEPMAGVNPALRQSVAGHIVEMRDAGVTVLNFIEHDMDVVMAISDWVVVLAEGRVVAEGPPDAIASNRLVIDAYLGTREPPGDTADA